MTRIRTRTDGIRGTMLVLPLVLLCSCQSIPSRNVAKTAKPRDEIAAPVQAANTGRGFGEGVAHASAILPVGHSHHVGMHSPACPHCGPGTLPPFAFSGAPVEESGFPWAPDGIKRPWPPDEYVCDGGDLNHDVHIKHDRTVVGLDQQDTIGHYDTLDGKREVTASNCICIYSPRFAAVRQITTPIFQEGHERMADVVKPSRVTIHEETRGPRFATQPEQLVAQVGLDQPQRFRERTKGLLVDQATRLVLAADYFLPHEDLLLIKRGQFEASEEARLSERVAAAITWTDIQAVQVLFGGQPAVQARGLARPEFTYTYELQGKGCLRLCKIADKSEAKSGEIVQFTLRFDNVGDQPISNVTIVDNLMPRLEYIAGTAESTLKGRFATQEQMPGESLVLRWEIEEPLAVNQGGIIRFQARVR